MLGFIERYELSAAKLIAFVAKCAQVMAVRRLPYHNFIHAIDVFQSLLVMLVHPKKKRDNMVDHALLDATLIPHTISEVTVILFCLMFSAKILLQMYAMYT